MRQRVALARTLFEDRPVVLMDEPFSALDAITRLELQDVTARLLAGRTVILVTHDPLEALRLGPRHPRDGRAPRDPRRADPADEPPRRLDDPQVLALQAELLRHLTRARGRMIALRALTTFAGLVVLWQVVVPATGMPHYLLPAPTRVAQVFWAKADILWDNAQITMLEIVLGLILGVLAGASCALLLMASRLARRWMLPVLIASQAIPTFAIAPLLVLWFGYGLGSKIVMAVLVIFFPSPRPFTIGCAAPSRLA